MDTGGDTSSDDVPDARVTDDSTSEQHYRRCDALRLNYGGAYRAVRKVEWSGHAFRADVDGTHLAAVLDAGLQVVCAAVRANTFIPVGVKEFHIAEGVEAWTPGARCVVHGGDSRATPGISRRGREIRTRRREANRKREVAQRET